MRPPSGRHARRLTLRRSACTGVRRGSPASRYARVVPRTAPESRRWSPSGHLRAVLRTLHQHREPWATPSCADLPRHDANERGSDRHQPASHGPNVRGVGGPETASRPAAPRAGRESQGAAAGRNADEEGEYNEPCTDCSSEVVPTTRRQMAGGADAVAQPASGRDVPTRRLIPFPGCDHRGPRARCRLGKAQ